MSITLKSYERDKTLVELSWDKYSPHFVVFVGHRADDGFYHADEYDRYHTEDEAKRAYRRQVAKVKRA